MKVKCQRLSPNAQMPVRAHATDAGFDLYATAVTYPSMSSGVFVEICTGISLEIPKGYAGFIFPRSSITNTKHFLRNSVGVIDSGYRGEIKLRFSTDESNTQYKIGDKIGQIVFLRLPAVQLMETKSLSHSDRNMGGFGSSGR